MTGPVLLVAMREITSRIRERGFVISVALSVVIVLAVVLVPEWLNRDTSSFDVALVGPTSQRLEPGLAAAGPDQVTIRTRTYPDEESARAAVRAGRVDAAIVDDARVVVDGTLDAKLDAAIQAAHRAVASQERLRAQGIDPQAVAAALDVAPLRQVFVDGDRTRGVRGGIAFLGVIILFGQLAAYGAWVAFSVVEEKSSRVVELLLAALRPWQLLSGKILGTGVLALGQLVLITGAGLGAALAVGTIDISAAGYDIIAQVFAWFVLAYAFFSSAYAAAAALVSRQEELNNVTGPMTLLLMASYVVGFFVYQNPKGTLAQVAALVPPFSALAMPPRTAAGQTSVWEIVLAVVLMLAATVVLVRLSARVYAGAVLHTGARVRIGDALRATRQPTPSSV